MVSRFLPQTKTFISFANTRLFYGWLNTISNQVDESRIEAVGCEVAAAEWLVRNGASVKWSSSDRWEKDYNSLPKHKVQNGLKIEEIDATDSSIMSVGFPHLKGVKNLKKIIIKRNHYLDDEALARLSFVKHSLKHLEIVSCSGVTEEGVISLKHLELSA
ncbi:ATP synthase subunit s: mitochondrial-like isoform X1 [Dinothrombium tinctorium]|uniref:ATP synthase subunit s: mitochondrial-like isoform X1 n=1 Tax=Dinothrombium tinctorium TaxID=1965070 RepID=A0A3S3PI11_9ACAR|nr:ATP synthase subunit s: mitochondrial-like isoform X1 [Dinothrombium tinctorium]RWS12870.1 ATP synthase subunit s: mitochondrial-like isoform X1 [Dinothrombium tinctorium]